MSLPPGPRQPGIVQLLRWARDPLAFIDDCARRFGEVFTVRFPGLGNFVFVSDPAHVKQVFTGDTDVLRAGEATEVLRPLVGSSSVVVLDGEEHLRQRRLLLPPFHGERMQAYATLMRDITDDVVDRWPAGGPFALQPWMQEITLEVILRAVFGVDEGAGKAELGRMLVELLIPPPAIFTFVPALQKDIPLSPYRAFLRRRERVDRALYAIIAERRRAGEPERRQDILSLLLAARDEAGQPMSDRELRDELVTLLAAGHETTATSLAWAFERILLHPEVEQRLRRELADVVGAGRIEAEHLGRLPYLDAVLKETARMRPVVPMVVRRLKAPFTVAGHELPPGAHLACCIWLAHMRPETYPEPRAFQPERFLGAKVDPYAWLPFGGGSRRCIGMAFALYEMKMVLAAVLVRARLRLEKRRPLAIQPRGLTLVPRGGTRVVLEERAPRRAGERRAS